MRRRPLAAGLLVVGLYLLSAMASGRLDIFARRPLLDGATPPPPYRWVTPPPDLAETNLKPDSKRQVVPFTKGVSDGEFVATDDGQASVVLPKGSIPSTKGATGASFTIEPRDPARFGGYPPRLRVRGNAYEIRGSYRGGSGGPLPALEPPARVILQYPAFSAALRPSHVVVHSADGLTWTTLETDNDSPLALQIAVSSPELGFFAVAAQPTPRAKKSPAPSPIVLVGAVVGVSGLAGFYAWRQAQARRRARRKPIPRSLPKKGGGGRRR